MAKKEKEGNGTKVAVHSENQALTPQTGGRSMQPASMTSNPLRWLHDEMDAVFDRFFGRWPVTWEPMRSLERSWDMGVEEKDDEILVRAEAPGFDPKDFDVQVGRNNLTIQAEHREESETNERNVQRWERNTGSFFRSIPLSTSVNADKVQANYRNGVLEVHLPRTESSPQRRVEVKS